MESYKDLMFDIEAERFNKWLAENYPDVVPDSKEWGLAANLYYWEQEGLADQAQWDHEHGLFVASLNNVSQRYQHACHELRKIHALLDDEQPELVYRMSFVHAVTVMDAYLIYCATALLEHEWPLRRFLIEFYLKSAPKVSNKDKRAACTMDIVKFRPIARNYVSRRLTFSNVGTIEDYFGAVLHVPPVWPLQPLEMISKWRNDLAHRNGVDEYDTPRLITVQQLQTALQKVSDLIEAAHLSLCLEVEYFGNSRTEENREIIASAMNILPTGDGTR